MRLGDVLLPFESLSKYLTAIEEMMGVMTEVVEEKGLEPPLFHIFSETIKPCPSLETNSFDEFPAWAIEPQQVKKAQSFHFPGRRVNDSLHPHHGTYIRRGRSASEGRS